MTTSFRLVALDKETFTPLFALTDEALAARGACRVVADAQPGYPCRVSLADAAPGERLLLLPFTHQPADGPYRASGPIFVREAAAQAAPAAGEVPETVRRRLLSVRAYDAVGLMVGAEICEGSRLEAQVERFFARGEVAYLHLHNARPGCFACRVERV